MRVIHLSYTIPKPAYTDPEVWLRRINFSIGVLEAMTKHAEIIGIYHIHYKGTLKRNGVTYYFPDYSRWQLILPFQFNQFIKNLNPDVIIVHGLNFPWQIVLLRLQIGRPIKIIAQHHAEPPLRDFRQYFQKWADRYIHSYIFASRALGRLWIEQGQIKRESKIKEVMGSSSPFFKIEKKQARLVTGVTGVPVYLWVGNLNPNKDPITLVKAFIQFTRLNKEARLYLIYQSDELVSELRALIKVNPVESEQIQLIGEITNSELLNWYNSVDFIISSSHYESGGIAVCEALSCGCIPILTSIPSFRMMTDNGRMGLLYDAGNEEALTSALVKSLTIERGELSQQILTYFKKELSFEANARKIMEVINS